MKKMITEDKRAKRKIMFKTVKKIYIKLILTSKRLKLKDNILNLARNLL